jgi:hypothetical protein
MLAFKRVLILDDGVNFGETMTSLFLAVADHDAGPIECAAFIDRLTSYHRKRLQVILSTRNSLLRSLFYFPFPVYHRRQCPLCKEARRIRRFLSTAPSSHLAAFAQRKKAQLDLEFLEPEPPQAPIQGSEVNAKV